MPKNKYQKAEAVMRKFSIQEVKDIKERDKERLEVAAKKEREREKAEAKDQKTHSKPNVNTPKT